MNLESKEVEELATTVNNAFAEFMRDIVNLDPWMLYPKQERVETTCLIISPNLMTRTASLIYVIALMYILAHLRERLNAVTLMMWI